MADNARKTSISRLFTRCLPPPPPCAFLKMPHQLSYEFRANESLRSCARCSVAFRAYARFGSFLRSEAWGEIKFPNGYLVSLLLLSVLIKILAKIRSSIYFCSLKFSKIPTLDDWTIAIFLVLDKQKNRLRNSTKRFANLLTVLMKFSVKCISVRDEDRVFDVFPSE